MGFAHINMDLIVGLPGESYDDVEHTMKELEAMAPDSVTVHSLAIKRAARLSLFKDKYEEMGLENNMQIMDMTANTVQRWDCRHIISIARKIWPVTLKT